MKTGDLISWLVTTAEGISGLNNSERNVVALILTHSDLLGSTIDALIAGADAEAIHEYIRAVLVAVSDAEMRREFPGQAA